MEPLQDDGGKRLRQPTAYLVDDNGDDDDYYGLLVMLIIITIRNWKSFWRSEGRMYRKNLMFYSEKKLSKIFGEAKNFYNFWSSFIHSSASPTL